MRESDPSITQSPCLKLLRDTCINQLESMVDKETMEECNIYIENRRELRHLKTLDRHLFKFQRLCHDYTGGHSNSWHGVHGENGCTNTNTCTATATTTANQGYLGDGTNNISSDNNIINNTSTNISTNTKTTNGNWVRNLSKTPLTEAQECLLAHGPNFVLVPREPSTCEYIAATEKVCQQLIQGKEEELRGEIKSLLKKNHKIKPNIPRDEYQVLREMKRDNTRMVLTADKGMSMVVVDREEYTTKSEELLHQPNYKILQTDPTNKYKNKLIGLLKSIKAEGGMDDNTYRRLYSTGAVPPKYYGLPKVHKPGMPLRLVISSIWAVSHSTAKELARIIKPLVGRSSHHVKNNMDFIQSIEGIQLKTEECMMSPDVEALFTSVPIEPAIAIIRMLLEEDKNLHQRTTMTVKQISCLLEFCLTATYFTFQGKIFEQIKGAAMGLP